MFDEIRGLGKTAAILLREILRTAEVPSEGDECAQRLEDTFEGRKYILTDEWVRTEPGKEEPYPKLSVKSPTGETVRVTFESFQGDVGIEINGTQVLLTLQDQACEPGSLRIATQRLQEIIVDLEALLAQYKAKKGAKKLLAQ